MITKEFLLSFEKDIEKEFIKANIKAPVHLSGGNEDSLINIFKNIRKQDWVFSTHRNHYHALLKGLPPKWVKQQIMSGHSMHLMSKKYKFFTSSIVGGCVPIAVGVAMSIKQKCRDEWVWILVGDMVGESGVFHEGCKYACNHILPITFIIEDNGLSTNTPTYETWNGETIEYFPNVIKYKYSRIYPHGNVEKWIVFDK